MVFRKGMRCEEKVIGNDVGWNGFAKVPWWRVVDRRIQDFQMILQWIRVPSGPVFMFVRWTGSYG